MNMPDWKELVRTVAPTIANALGGPLAGLATQAISTAILGKPDATHDEISAVMAVASPDTLLKLKQAEQDFTAKMKELDIELEKIGASDRDSARKREIEVKDKTPRNLSIAAFVGFFGILLSMMFYDFPDNNHDVMMVMIGVLGGMVTSIVSYYFGSSSGSAAKTATIDKFLSK